ncbi:MAG TPA: mechanosensitive ion channel family protein [Methylomirabilota bacterium]|nr:mechanosensitive ion channel family protein [Methylomirabilota bacterium]
MTEAGGLAALLARWTRMEPAAATAVAHALSIAVTAIVLLLAYRVLLRLIERLVQGVAARRGDTARSRTLGSLLTSVLRWGLAFIIIVVLLRELGVDVQAILVSAGVLGLAIGLGAQALIRDLITGVFLLFEGLVAVGDVVQVGPATGTVESIGLRVTKLRLPDGSIRVVPNGALAEFTNFSGGWARAIVEIAVPHDVDVERALTLLREAGEAWARDNTGAALDAPSAQGIMRFNGADPVLRLSVRVDAARRVDVESDLRRRIKAVFDRERLLAAGA